MFFLQNVLSLLKFSNMKAFEFQRVTLQEKKLPVEFLTDEIDVDSNLFQIFFDVWIA